MHTTGPHAILYAHANSTAELDAQHAAVTAYCQDRGLDLVTEFHDVGDRRHGLDMLLHAATDPAVSYVITPHWSPDHLTSSEVLFVQEALAHHGAWLVSFTTQDEADEATAHYAGAVPLELLKEEQERLGRELAGIERALKSYEADATLVRSHLDQALDLLEDCHRMYTAAPDHLKKLLNQVFFTRILINPETDENGHIIVPPDRLAPRPGQEENTSTDNRTTQPAPDITIHDPTSHTTAAAFLIPPFDQLASSRLQHAAMTSPQPKTSAPKDGRTDRGADARAGGSTSAGATTHNEAAGGARRGTTAGTTAHNRAAANTNTTAQGDGSYKRLMVVVGGFKGGGFSR